jgi:hypothetical protein
MSAVATLGLDNTSDDDIRRISPGGEVPPTRLLTAARAQQVIVFLAKTGGFSGRWERARSRSTRTLRTFHSRYLKNFAPDWYEVHGRKSYIQRLDRKLTIDAIRDFRKYRSPSKLHQFLSGTARQTATARNSSGGIPIFVRYDSTSASTAAENSSRPSRQS